MTTVNYLCVPYSSLLRFSQRLLFYIETENIHNLWSGVDKNNRHFSIVKVLFLYEERKAWRNL